MDLVMISIDDLFALERFRDAFGVAIHTPNFDRLAAEGVSFSNAYPTVALCNPSRTSILSGESPFTTGVQLNTDVWYQHVDPAQTLPGLMKAAGWSTYSYGKVFHSFTPPDIAAQMFNGFYEPTNHDYGLDDITAPFGVDPGDPAKFGDELALNRAIQTLQTYTDPKPLLLMMGFVDPHAPFMAPAEDFQYYPLDQIVVPDWQGDSPPDFLKPYMGESAWQNYVESGLAAQLIQAYLANITEMDARLGRLLDAIEADGRDTAIVLYSDHGFSMGDHDYLGKFTLWEQSTAAPLIFYHPSMSQHGTTDDQVVSFLDIAPTVLDMAGVSIPDSMQGQSLLDVVLDPGAPTGRDDALTSMGGSFSLRTGDFRYTLYLDGSVELFQVSTDAAGSHNLHGDPAFAAEDATMAASLQARLGDLGVLLDTVHGLAEHDDPVTGDTQYFTVDQASLNGVVDAGGHDIVYTGASRFDLPAWAEDLTLFSEVSARLKGNDLDNVITGYVGRLVAAGEGGDDRISGSASNDLLNGGEGDDTLAGANGRDSLLGGAGADHLYGNDGPDKLDGGEGPDFLSGGDDGDRLLGGAGDDVLAGGDGRDILRGGPGNDRLTGGAGRDTFDFAASDAGRDVVTDYDARFDQVVLDGVDPGEVTVSLSHGSAVISYGAEQILLAGVDAFDLRDILFL